MKDKTLELIKSITIKEIYNILDKLEYLYSEREKIKNPTTIRERGYYGSLLGQIDILENRHDDLIKELKLLSIDV